MKKAPKGKGQGSRTKKAPKPPKQKTKSTTAPRNRITIDTALEFLKSQGVEVTEDTRNELIEIAKVRTIYQGKKPDKTAHRKRLMLQALEHTLGNVTKSIRVAGISRTRHYEWMNEDEEYHDLVTELNDIVLDLNRGVINEIAMNKNAKDRDRLRAAMFQVARAEKMKQFFSPGIGDPEEDNVRYWIPDNGREDFLPAQIVKE